MLNVSKDAHLDTSKKLYNASNAKTLNVLDATHKLNKPALIATKATYLKTENALLNAVQDFSPSKSLLMRTTVDLAIKTVLFAMAP
jgi:hypothetical protein